MLVFSLGSMESLHSRRVVWLRSLPHIPLDRIVLETDSPYLAPVPFRGKRNESSYIKNVAMKLAEIYGLDFKDVDRITANNALKVFKMAE